MAAMTIVPTSGNIISTKTACNIFVTAATVNDTTTYNANNYPTEAAFRYYIFCDDGVTTTVLDGKSYVFTPAADGTFMFPSYIFPTAGTWTVRLRNAATDADVTTISVTVS